MGQSKVNVAGTTPEMIDTAEDRNKFSALLDAEGVRLRNLSSVASVIFGMSCPCNTLSSASVVLGKSVIFRIGACLMLISSLLLSPHSITLRSTSQRGGC